MMIIENMPTLLGEQFYPGGFPLPADKVSVNGKTVQEIFFDTCDGNYPDDDPRVKIVDDYYRYFLLAPCWDLGEITLKEIMEADSERLLEMCMESGIDPL